MRSIVSFAVIVIVSFAGMVALRENHRRIDAPTTVVTQASDSHAATISTGNAVAVEKHLAEGRWTVIEFMAEW